eukprot:CAMPEP_0118936366 /NCGR_PEP_ID=MMETSP1169-20130426/18333_1 /TAXON_ID=36882 /ORGANISM="Pyramimonas obovata, Strain CCMP722" /LENGTH=251 /DNA_ID=CAMNT_0006879589 /DNA_START=20 /DNA_END=775 /DNA_ORIENTATION=+
MGAGRSKLLHPLQALVIIPFVWDEEADKPSKPEYWDLENKRRYQAVNVRNHATGEREIVYHEVHHNPENWGPGASSSHKSNVDPPVYEKQAIPPAAPQKPYTTVVSVEKASDTSKVMIIFDQQQQKFRSWQPGDRLPCTPHTLQPLAYQLHTDIVVRDESQLRHYESTTACNVCGQHVLQERASPTKISLDGAKKTYRDFTVDEVAEWVSRLGLDPAQFKRNAVAGKDLPHLTSQELEVRPRCALGARHGR